MREYDYQDLDDAALDAIAEDRAERRRRFANWSTPDCRDPDHDESACPICSEEE